MNKNTGEFFNAVQVPGGFVEDEQGKKIPEKDLLSFHIGEEIKIKGHTFVITHVDVALHRMTIKSKKRFKVD